MANDAPTIVLASNDQVIVTASLPAANQSILIHNLLLNFGDMGFEAAIPIPNVKGDVLAKVMQWCEHFRNEAQPDQDDFKQKVKTPEEIPEWVQDYFKVESDILFAVITAANYLDIPLLLAYGCRIVANMIKSKSTQEIRNQFGIVNDFIPEGEEKLRTENAWAQDPK
ncbi:Uu.00g007520.m01.CDS01 [Anthostomella pinea]|uniref:E3 ubiquitin ligase complex SCF subunit n=1 Tax=Anthostomella pinea TaxID=933095 RepID=A0AAI8YPS7_9PEZI|nr:Uu.00g007520.m01.CDS01 [Anthostomella pinea]